MSAPTLTRICLDWQPGTVDASMPICAAGATREDLAHAFAEHGFTKGAEIGVERGKFSEVLLDSNPNLHLICVDAWRTIPGYRAHVAQDQLDGFYRDTALRLSRFRGRVTLVRDFSVPASFDVPDGSLDFVYIDGGHDFGSVVADLQAWVPKVRSGGIVSGHDFVKRDGFHVREAVEMWTQCYGVSPWFVLTGDRSPSWLWVKK